MKRKPPPVDRPRRYPKWSKQREEPVDQANAGAAPSVPPSWLLGLPAGVGLHREPVTAISSSVADPLPQGVGASPQPKAEAVTPPRGDAIPRKRYTRGCLPDLQEEAWKQSALETLESDELAATTQMSNASRLKTVTRILAAWGMTFPPLTVEAVRALAATLKHGGYRSAKLYLSAAKVAAEKEIMEGTLPVAVLRAITDANRSCLRGLGPGKQSDPLPFLKLLTLPDDVSPWVGRGFLSSKLGLVVGCWFMLREIEFSNMLARHVTFTGTGEDLHATLLLPSSKCDPQALGLERTHGCSCKRLGKTSCPAHGLQMQVRRLHDRFGVQGQLPAELPLWPTVDGVAVTKDKVVDTIEHAAGLLGLSAWRSDGLPRFTGHTMRVTGAQFLASHGLDPSLVALFGRWSSGTVWHYLRDAPLADSNEWAGGKVPATPVKGNLKESLADEAMKAQAALLKDLQSETAKMWGSITEMYAAVRDIQTQRSESQRSEIQRSENQRSENRRSENQRSENQRSENQMSENQRSESPSRLKPVSDDIRFPGVRLRPVAGQLWLALWAPGCPSPFADSLGLGQSLREMPPWGGLAGARQARRF
eukprot:6480776-Amphidinium_carterae.1